MQKSLIRALGCALFLAFGLFWQLSTTARAETLVYTDTIPLQPMRWVDAMTFPRFDPTLGILTRVEISLTGGITGTTSYTNQVNAVTQVSIDVPANVRLQLPNSALLNAGGTIFSFTENVAPFGSGSRTFAGIVANNTAYTDQANLTAYIGAGQLTVPVTATSSFIAGGDIGNFDFSVRTTANATGVVRYTYAIPQIAIKKFTNGFDADNPNDSDVPRLNPGDAVTWTYLVTNTGSISIPLASVNLSDSQPGVTPVLILGSDTNVVGQLESGETWFYMATGFLAEDLAAPTVPVTLVPGCNPGGAAAPGNRLTYRNIGTVIVPGDSASDPSHYCNPPQPGIVIQKLTNGFDADGPNDNDVPQIPPGATVTWTYLVTNTGNITFALASVVVTDDQLGVTPVFVPASDAGNDSLLSPGEVWRYTATGTAANLLNPPPPLTVVAGCNPSEAVAPGFRNTYANIGMVTVPGAQASDPSHYCNPPQPGITIRKLTNGADANDPNGNDVPRILPGLTVTWTYIITNTGNVTFTVAQVTVTDSHSSVIPVRVVSSDQNSDGLLTPGESWRYVAVGIALDVKEQVGGVTFVEGCQLTVPPFNNAYANIGGVRVPGATASDPSHYCNPVPTGLLPDGSEPQVHFFLPLIRR